MVAFGAGEEDTRAAPRRPDNTQPLRTSIILESWHVLQHVESQGLDEEADRRVIVPHDERLCELNAALASPDPLRVLLRCPSVTIWFIRAAMSGTVVGRIGTVSCSAQMATDAPIAPVRESEDSGGSRRGLPLIPAAC